jgi:voltage-gated potassium channel
MRLAKDHRRLIGAALLRSLLTATVLVVVYYILPVAERWHMSAALRLVGGLAVFFAVLGWQIRIVVKSPYPVIRAIETLAIAVPLFLLIFAGTYFWMSADALGNFNQESLSRSDTLYFAVSTFATVGFGDITATSQIARLVVTFQMILDLLILGVGVNAIVGLARWRRRQESATGVEGPIRADDTRAHP